MTSNTCDVPGCSSKAVGGGYCMNHQRAESRKPQGASPARPTSRSSEVVDLRGTGAAIAVAGGLMMLSAFLPWVQASEGIFEKSFTGMDSNYQGFGVIVLVAGAVIMLAGLGLFATFEVPNFVRRSPIVSGLFVGLFAVIQIYGTSNRVTKLESSSRFIDASVGMGLWVLLVSSAAAFLLGFKAHQS